VRHVDEALSLLVGTDAGSPNEKGHFPKGSVNARVVARLREIAEIGMEEVEPSKESPPVIVATGPAAAKPGVQKPTRTPTTKQPEEKPAAKKPARKKADG
jgi:hypothetical protein